MRHMKLTSIALATIALASVATAHAQTSNTAASNGSQSNTQAAATASNVNVVNIPTVIVGNSAATPVPVAPTAKEFYQAVKNFDLTNNNTQTVSFAVPAGKRFVVEHVSVWGLGSGTQFTAWGLPDNTGGSLQLPIEMHQLGDATSMYWGAQARILSVVDQVFATRVERTYLAVGAFAWGQVFVSGYLIPAQ